MTGHPGTGFSVHLASTGAKTTEKDQGIGNKKNPVTLATQRLRESTTRCKKGQGQLVRMRSAVRICPAAPKSIENFGFRCFFVAKTLKMVWVKMRVNCLTHTVTHTRKCPDGFEEYRRGSFCLLSGISHPFSAYITCAMKLPIVCAASSCFCLVAWV